MFSIQPLYSTPGKPQLISWQVGVFPVHFLSAPQRLVAAPTTV